MKRTLIVVACTLGVLSCSKDSNPAAPTPAPVLACVTNNTAQLSFRNGSSTVTMDVVVDGIKSALSPLAPGVTVGPVTLAAGVAHSVQFRVTNSMYPACSSGAPVLAQCSTQTVSCTP
jgi:hypothetical protein